MYVFTANHGSVLMQVPSNMIVGKIRWPGVYICIAMAIWGLVSALTAVTHNAAGLMASRFFLGFIEAVFFPGALFYLSLFYTRKQFALRTAILYSGSQLGNAFGGLFAIGILELDGKNGIAGWRWVSTSAVLRVAFPDKFPFSTVALPDRRRAYYRLGHYNRLYPPQQTNKPERLHGSRTGLARVELRGRPRTARQRRRNQCEEGCLDGRGGPKDMASHVDIILCILPLVPP